MFGWITSVKEMIVNLKRLDKIAAEANAKAKALAAELKARADEAEAEIIDAEWETIPVVRINAQPVLTHAGTPAEPKRSPGRPRKDGSPAQPRKPAKKPAKRGKKS